MFKERQRTTQLIDHADGKRIAIDGDPRFLQVGPGLVHDIVLHVSHHHVQSRPNDDLCGIACFSRQFNQDPRQLSIVEIQIVGPFYPHLIGTQIVQHLCHHNADHQAQPDGRSWPLFKPPVHGKVEVGAKW